MHSYRFIRFTSLLALLAILCFQNPRSASAATSVCGLIEAETWTLAGSPYLVMCDVQVDSLVIQPGVVVQFESNYVFQVTGFLMATGAVFTTTNTAAGWQGIFFNEVAPLSALDSCIIEGSVNSGARIKDCIVQIRNCTFRNNSGSQGGGIDINNTLAGLGEFVLSGCTFSNNVASAHGGAVRATVGNNSIRFTSCAVLNNSANPSSSAGDYYGGGLAVFGDGDATFSNCHIAGNVVRACAESFATRYALGGGVGLSGNGNAFFKNCMITNNGAFGGDCGGINNWLAWGGGLYKAYGRLTVLNCIIAYNTSSGGGNGSGIYVDTANGSIENCTIVYNNNFGLVATDATVVRNSILYFNNSGGTQLTSTTNVWFSCVQNGSANSGNIAIQPSLNPACLRITFSSPCKDAGDPDPAYNDVCINDTISCAPVSRGTSRNDMGAHGGAGACCWDAPCAGPVPGQLQARTTCAGMNVTFCISAVGADPLSYQWRYHGTNAANPPMNIANATNSCLMLSNVSSNNAGYYSVRVSNPFGGVDSNPALLLVFPVCLSLELYPGLSITGQVGRAYCIQYTTDLSSNPLWTSLTNFTLSTPDFFYRDLQPARRCEDGQAGPPQRFYRVIEGGCP